MTNAVARSSDDKVHVDMTPMIDIVFQLLVFFALTLNVVEAEGDFRIRMPMTGGLNSDRALPPLRLELSANEGGGLQALRLNQQPLADFAELRRRMVDCVQDVKDSPLASELEVEIASDPDLRYEFMIAAITAISGDRTADGRLVPLIERIKFASQK